MIYVVTWFSINFQEEKRTLERELARVKVSANRIANVVANEWKDENDKVMPVRQWLEERRIMQVYLPLKIFLFNYKIWLVNYKQEVLMIKYVHAYAGRDATIERKASYIRENSKGRITIEGNLFVFHVSI